MTNLLHLNPIAKVQQHIDNALQLIEECIKLDPHHIKEYLYAKEHLLTADSSINHAIWE
jgi:hypothetical protein